MAKSVFFKRSLRRRALALAGALFLMLSVLILPASAYLNESAVDLGAPDKWKAFDFVYGSDGVYQDGLPFYDAHSGRLPQYTAGNPYCVTYSNIAASWRDDGWTYISFEIASFEDASHWTLGLWQRTGGSGALEIVWRFAYYDAATSSNSFVGFERILGDPQDLDAKIITEYWTQTDADGTPYTMCRFFFDVANNDAYDYSYTFRIDDPFQIRVKTEYAGVTYDLTEGNINPLSPSYISGNQQGYQSGYTDGYAVGEESGYNAGVSIGFDNGYYQGLDDEFREFDRLYENAGGSDPYLTVGQEGTITKYFNDLGWTECANQGALTMRIVYGVLEAPLNVILGGMNFTIFGINLAQTIFAVFSIILVFAIVRIVLAVLPLV